MKILFINTYYYPNLFGGTEQSLYLLANGLKTQQQCAVFTVDGLQKAGLTKELINDVLIYRSGTKNFNFESRFNKTETILGKIKNRLADIYNPKALSHFKQVIDEFAPDIIHTNGLRGIGPQIWKIAAKKNIKVVHTLRDYYVLDPTMKLIHTTLFFKLWRSFFLSYFKYISVLTAPSAFTLNTVLSYKKNNTLAVTQVVPNCITFKAQELEQNFSNNNHSTPVKYLFVGTLVEYKGILQLLEAFKLMKNKDAELIICGTGPLSENIKQESLCDKRIKYKGQLQKEALIEQYKQADVCIIPSLWEEPFGRVVIEAAYYANALIASDKGGIPEIIKTLQTGILCDCSNPITLSQAMDNLFDANNRNQQLIQIEKNISLYSLEKQIDTFNKIYLDIGTQN
jgi:glycosyltransferase involved in cell wall biosynthesis